MKNNQGQRLSPENYIRNRARTLQLGDCFINGDWRETGFAMITVTRQHLNGNVTHGAFIVDLYCTGLKESFWKFNEHPAEFRDYIEKYVQINPSGVRMKKINYALVHNIIYGAIAFAEDFGFRHHKSFDITKYILEEDDERIKLIDIEFGYKGKPLYVSTPENPSECNRVLAILEKNAGKGNFYFITEAEAMDFFKQEEEVEELNDSPLDYNDPKVKCKLISELLKKSEKSDKSFYKNPEKFNELILLAEKVYLEYMVTANEKKTATEMVESLFDFNIDDQIFSDDMIFGKSTNRKNYNEIRKEAELLFLMIGERKIEQGQIKAEKLIRVYPEVPVFKYILLRFIELKNGISKLKSTFKHYADTFPDYLPFTHLWLQAYILEKNVKTDFIFPEQVHLKNYYPGKKVFCTEEILIYVHLLLVYYHISGQLTNLLMLVRFFDTRHPEFLPVQETLSGRVLALPYILTWCNNWLEKQNG